MPDRAQLEVINNESRIALIENDREWYVSCLERGMKVANDLKSKKRLKEISTIFHNEVPVGWRKDTVLQQVAERYSFSKFS